MWKALLLFMILLSVFLSACSSSKSNPEPLGGESDSPIQSDSQQLIPEVSTTMPEVPVTPASDANNQPPSTDAIVFADNGKIFRFDVGDSFLLNLGDEVYEWNVSVENQNVVALKMGIMIIKGAQGNYEALNPGVTTLTAIGDPLCRKSSPPCGMPTILFRATLVVE